MSLSEILEAAKSRLHIGGFYYHYKNSNHVYRVLDVGLNETTHRPQVMYRALYGDGLTWVRDLEQWEEQISQEGGEKVARFTKA